MEFDFNRMIAVRFGVARGRFDLDDSLRAMLSGQFEFNHRQPPSIVGARIEDYGRVVDVALCHEDLPELDEGEMVPVMTYPTARRRFPFLFTDTTNPLLYRRFRL